MASSILEDGPPISSRDWSHVLVSRARETHKHTHGETHTATENKAGVIKKKNKKQLLRGERIKARFIPTCLPSVPNYLGHRAFRVLFFLF